MPPACQNEQPIELVQQCRGGSLLVGQPRSLRTTKHSLDMILMKRTIDLRDVRSKVERVEIEGLAATKHGLAHGQIGSSGSKFDIFPVFDGGALGEVRQDGVKLIGGPH